MQLVFSCRADESRILTRLSLPPCDVCDTLVRVSFKFLLVLLLAVILMGSKLCRAMVFKLFLIVTNWISLFIDYLMDDPDSDRVHPL